MSPLMRADTDTERRPRRAILIATTVLLLAGCGVSGKPVSDASPQSTTSVPTTASTIPTTTETTPPETTPPETTPPETTLPPDGSGDTTIPSGDSTTTPDTTNSFGPSEIRRTLIRIYKQSGFTDREANCVADLIVKQSGNGTFDPSKLDVSRLGAEAQRCFGADGAPGGSD